MGSGPLDLLGWPFSFLVDGAAALGLGAAAIIVFLVALIRVALFPVAHHQARSLHVLGQISPRLREIHERLADDRQALRAELTSVYAEHRVTPFGVILSIIPQAIVLVGLYLALRPEINSAAPSDLLGDLADPARSSAVGIAMIVLYMAGFSATLWLSSKRTTGEVSRLTRAMMLAVPAGALAALPITSTGLALYLGATALTSLAQAYLLYRVFPRDAQPART